MRTLAVAFMLAPLTLALVARPSAAAAGAAARAAVVRVEAAVDPFTFGPGLAAEASARDPSLPFPAELSRRLRTGSVGTGFLVNADGDVVTNAHVVLSGVRYRALSITRAQWDSLAVLLNAIRDIWVTVRVGEEDRCYLAVPVAIAEDLDLAVVRIRRPPGDETRFTPLPIGDSDAVRVGDGVAALGFPDDAFVSTSGRVLSLIYGVRVHDDMQIVRRVDPRTGEETTTVSGTSNGPLVRLQHSAPTGHGSSGGPLLDAHGSVIGVCYALLSRRQPGAEDLPAAGLNLAIASNVLRQFLKNIPVRYTEAAR